MARAHAPAREWPLELTKLGLALERQVDVLANRLLIALGHSEDDPHRKPLQLETRTATTAFARWLATGDPSEARAAGRDACHSFGRVVAADGISTTHMIRGCQTWRNVVAEVLVEEAQCLLTPDPVLAQARAMLQRTHNVTILQFAGAFDVERERLSEELRARENQLLHQATHDGLTGLPNRHLTLARLEALLAQDKRMVGVLFIDLDGFKAINDTFGHRGAFSCWSRRLNACGVLSAQQTCSDVSVAMNSSRSSRRFGPAHSRLRSPCD